MVDFDFRTILSALADAVVAADQSGRIVYVNAAAETLLGWPAGELIGQPLIALVPPRLRDAHQAGFSRYLTTRVPRIMGSPIRVAALRRDGGEVEVDLVLAAVPLHGEDDLIVASLRDVREHVELERQLAITRYLRAATRAAAALTAILDLEHVLATAVEAMVSDLDAALARIWLYESDTNTLHLRASGGLSTAMSNSLRARIDVATYPYKVGVVARTRQPFIKNGLAGDAQFDQQWIAREGIAAVAVLPLLIGAELRGVLVYFSHRPLVDDLVDVLSTFATMISTALDHARVLAREQAARAEAQETQLRLAVLAEANAGLLRQAQQAMRERDDFIATATHDLKNPLVAIKGLAQILQRRMSGGDAPDMERFADGLAHIDAAASRMAALIDELLDITRLRAGEPLALEPSPTDLVALARQLAGQYQQGTERHHIHVETALAELICAVDAVRLERVLGNLLSNAVKFSPDGGTITVTIGREDGGDGEDGGNGAGWAVLEVRDEGLGIPASDLPLIFERGHRASNVEGVSGTGIGLAGVRHIVERHGGRISAHSRPGEGATFTLRLPLTVPDAGPPAAPEAYPAAEARPDAGVEP